MGSIPGEDVKILIVDDNADSRKFLRFNLEHHGVEAVIEAESGKKGLEMARVHKPDFIISDALMPVMDGFQFLRSIKTDEDLKSIPFIFYSSIYTGYKEAELAISLGAEAFIIKPKEPEEFWVELNDIIEDFREKTGEELTEELIKDEEEFRRKHTNIVAEKLNEKVKKTLQ